MKNGNGGSKDVKDEDSELIFWKYFINQRATF